MEVSYAKRLANYLIGTSISFYTACEDLGINDDFLTDEDIEDFDTLVFRCDECGIWYDRCDIGMDSVEGLFCIDCWKGILRRS